MPGQISLLVSRDLSTLVQVARGLPREVAAQLRAWTKADAGPIWDDEIRPRAETRIQAAALTRTARVSVSDTNVMMKSATVGKVHGVSASVLAAGAEFGASPNKVIRTHSRRGKAYTRRLGSVFLLPRRRGYVVFTAAGDATPRLASLWLQTAIRTVAEAFEKDGS